MAIDVGVWIAFALTLLTYSYFLAKDNILFRFAIITLSACVMGNVLVISLRSIHSIALMPILSGTVYYVIPVFMGLTILLGLFRKHAYLSRPAVSLPIGVGLGITVRGVFESDIRRQIIATMTPLVGGKYTPIDNLLMIVIVITIISYFVFTKEQKGSWGGITRVGRIFLMGMFGVFFANTAVTRFTYLAGRVLFLLQTLGLM